MTGDQRQETTGGERVASPAASALACPLDDDRITDVGLLIETHARLTRALGAELERRCSLPLTWFDVLIRLGRSPERRMTMTELAHQVALTSGGATRLVDRIADAGLVERISCPSDRRSIYVGLTASGAQKLEEAIAVHLESLEIYLVEPLTAHERKSLRTTLRKLLGPGPVCGDAEALGDGPPAGRRPGIRPSR